MPAPSRLPKLIATDLDGTLLRSDRTLSNFTHDVLRDVEAAGIPLIVVTGRPIGTWLPIASAVPLHGPLVLANGGLVLDRDGVTVLAEWPISPIALQRSMSEIRERVPGVAFAVERGGELVYEKRYPALAEVPPRRCTEAKAEELHSEPAHMLRVWVEGELQPKHVATSDLTVAFPGPRGFMAAVAAGVTKATAAQWVAARLHVDPADVLAFGDMENDVPMLSWAGTGIAVGRAHPDLLAVAHQLIDGPDGDGIARYLEGLLRAAATEAR